MADIVNTKGAVALTRDAKAAIQLAFEDLGGVPRLVQWAQANNGANLGQFYTQIWSKIVPRDVKAELDGRIIIEVVKFGEGDRPEAVSMKRTLDDGMVVETTASLIEKSVADGNQD